MPLLRPRPRQTRECPLHCGGNPSPGGVRTDKNFVQIAKTRVEKFIHADDKRTDCVGVYTIDTP